MDAGGASLFTIQITNERLFTGDWTRGAAGTNEYVFWLLMFHGKFEIPNLCESWEIPDPSTVIFHIRQGVHYGLNPRSEASRLVNGREMTAEDVAFCIHRKWTGTGYYASSRPGWFQSATATDKWTVVVKGDDSKQKTALMFQYLTMCFSIYPPEIIGRY